MHIQKEFLHGSVSHCSLGESQYREDNEMNYNHCNHSLFWCHNTSSFIFCFKFFSLSTITLVSLGGSSGGMIQTHIAQSYQSLVILPFSGWDCYTSTYSHSYNGARKCQKSPRQIIYVLHIFLLDAIMTLLFSVGSWTKRFRSTLQQLQLVFQLYP